MQKKFVKNITFNTPYRQIEENLGSIKNEDIEFHISKRHYNKNMHKYLEIHKKRVLS